MTPDRLDATFAALADPTRRAILEAIRKRARSVGDLASTMPVSRPAVSQHLAVLRDAQLVTEERDGTRRFYQANTRGMQLVQKYLDRYWSHAIGVSGVTRGRTKRR